MSGMAQIIVWWPHQEPSGSANSPPHRPASIMPAIYETMLKPEDIDHLVAYLATLK